MIGQKTVIAFGCKSAILLPYRIKQIIPDVFAKLSSVKYCTAITNDAGQYGRMATFVSFYVDLIGV